MHQARVILATWISRFPLYVSAFMIITMIGCKNRHQKILEEFKKVNDSLQTSLDQIHRENVESYSRMEIVLLFSQITSLRDQGTSSFDSAKAILNNAIQADMLVDSIKSIFEDTAIAEADTDISNRLLVNTQLGNDLYKKTSRVYEAAQAGVNNEELKAAINEQGSIFFIPGKETWTEMYFKGTPKVAALTILSKLEYSYGKAALLRLTHIKEQLERTLPAKQHPKN